MNYRGDIMLSALIDSILNGLLFFALHIENGSAFPKPLSAAEEKECFLKMSEGDKEARNKLIEHNMRLVAHVVRKYYGSTAEQDDLISIGTIGLIKAVSSYNYSRNIRFATYASKCIDNEVLMYFRSLRKTALDVYMDDPIDTDKDGNTMTLMDIITVDDCMVDKIDSRIKAGSLYEFVETVLDEREAQIIRFRYGLYGTKPLTQREVAKKLDISRSYVSRIEKRALEKLKEKYDNTKLL
ncbi:MAG: RNA polymerase sporulation sigma factor SigK [Oscillospiraceae bacterium]|nr:RNA polymerase sporulation sigma factor SigK [Oscillospiraceae bacterium]